VAWVKLSDTFAEDPRLDRAGPLALALHVAALCWCNRQLTDGLIPRATVRRLLDLDAPDDVAGRLVDAELWEETADGYQLLGYLDDQPSRVKVLARRAQKAEAGRAGGVASGRVRRSKSEANTKHNGSRSVEHPSRPDPKGQGAGPATAAGPAPSSSWSTDPPCEHGQPGGNSLNPLGMPRCPLCRKQARALESAAQ